MNTKKRKELIAEAKRLGFEVEYRKSGHLRFRHPDKRVSLVTASCTASEYRANANALAILRRAVRVIEENEES